MIALPSKFAPAQPTPATQTQSSAPTQIAQPPQQLKVTAYTLPPDKLVKAQALYTTDTVLYLFGMAFGIVLLWILLKLRVAPVFRDLAERVAKNRFLQALVFVPLLTLLIAVISLPIDLYHHHISLAYGLSIQSWASWMADWCKGQGISLVIMVPTVWGLFWIIRKSPERWWFYFWLVTLPFLVLLVFVAPVILDPMFNTFEPLEKTQPQLVSEIEKVTQRGGLSIPRDRMFEMKASEKYTTYNAYVTGLGATKRVVVWDNTSRDLTIPETLFVFGHEMGHYVLDHIYKGLAFLAGMMLVGFWLGRKIVLAMLARWGEAWHIRGIGDLAAFPVLMLALSLLSLAGEPIGNAFSRHIEHQADIYGLEVTHGLFPNNAEVAASAFQKLGEKSYDYPNPNPLLVFWSYNHPSITERIRFSLQYDPWQTPAGPKYVK
jgi:Zn-dependent protease with chaperone function